MSEAPADLLRRAADRLENPPIEPGVRVRYAPTDKQKSRAWEDRIGREYTVVEVTAYLLPEDGKRVVVFVPGDHEDDEFRGDTIYPGEDSVIVVVPERDKALARWLRSIDISGISDEMYAAHPLSDLLDDHALHALSVARAILGEVAS